MRSLRKSAALMAAVGLAGGVVAACPGVASATQANQAWAGTQNSNGIWNYLGNTSGGGGFRGQIRNFHAGSGMCLSVPDSAFNPPFGVPSGAQVELDGCQNDANHADTSQDWIQSDNGDGSWSYSILLTSDLVQDECLDSLAGHHYDGSPVEVWPCNGDSAQKWTIGPGGELQSVDAPGFCADATNWGTTNGTPIQLWRCT